MNKTTNSSQCPFCLNNNLCQSQTKKQCWCFSAAIPQALLRLLPQQSDKSCICRTCIQAYGHNPKAFILKYQQPPKPGD